jgi:hypothetical protein
MKEARTTLSTSDKLKLSKAAREGGDDKFTFFESDGNDGGDFRAVYDLHMRLEALSKVIMFYDMEDVFQILSKDTVQELETKLSILFASQAAIRITTDTLTADLSNQTLKTDLASAVANGNTALDNLEAVSLTPVNILKNYKDLEEDEVRQSNK